jgi:hypothetical protein
MIKLTNLLKESADLQKYQPNAVASNSYVDFLKSLVGQRLQALLDSASFARLYLGNKYGFSDHDLSDKQVLLSNLMSATTDFINFRKLNPLRAKLDAVDAEDKKTPAYQAYHKQRMDLVRASFAARKAGDEKKAQELQAQSAALTDPSSYRKNMDDMQALVKQFHGSPLSLQDVLPSGSDSEDDKKRFAHAEKAFNAFKAAS